MDLINDLKNNYFNLRGFRTNRKIIVIESDDWGSIRIKSKKDYNDLLNNRIIKDNIFNKYDSLESIIDLEYLFNVLNNIKDINNNPLRITANFNVANPNFDKIKSDNFKNYYFDEFIESYSKYNGETNTLNIINEGVKNHFFFPQYHGREHVQVEYWLRDLQNNLPKLREGFNHDFFAFSRGEITNYSYLSSFYSEGLKDLEPIKRRILDGFKIFENTFKYKSTSIIAPENTIHMNLIKYTSEIGIKVIQGARVGKNYDFQNKQSNRTRFMGLRNKYNQTDIVRNVVFEPCSSNIDWVNKGMKEISNAFYWNKPAVICSHRFNYIGKIDENNRSKGLIKLKELIVNAQKKWSDIEFMTTEELYNLIKKDNLNISK